MKRAYILTFDRDDLRDYKKIHGQITSLPEISNWFHHLKSSYILISSTDKINIVEKKLKGILKNKRHFIVEINLKFRNGLLPRQGWEWLQKQSEKMESVN